MSQNPIQRKVAKIAKVLRSKELSNLFAETLMTRYLDNHVPESELPDGVRMYDTFAEAYDACKQAEEDSGKDWHVYPREDTALLDYMGQCDWCSASEFAHFRCRVLYGEDRDEGELDDYYKVWELGYDISFRYAHRRIPGGTFGKGGKGISDDIALDAQLIVGVTLAGLLGDYLPSRDVDIAEKRWRVWVSGYGVISDYDDVIYCYRKVDE